VVDAFVHNVARSAPVIAGHSSVDGAAFHSQRRFVDTARRALADWIGFRDRPLLLAAGALAAALVNRATTHEVPDLRNQSESRLLDTATANGWRTARVELRDIDVAAATSSDTDPVAGRKLERAGCSPTPWSRASRW